MACTYEQYLSTSHCNNSEEHQARTFHSLVIQGKLCIVVPCIIQIYKGGVMHLRYA